MRITSSNVVRLFLLLAALGWAFLPGCQTKKTDDAKGHDHAGHDHAGHDHKDSDQKASAVKTSAKTPADEGCGCGKPEEKGCGKAEEKGCGHAAQDHAGHDHAAHDDHADHAAHEEHAHEGVPVADNSGPLDEKLGQALAGIEVVKVLDLQKDAGTFEGKTIRLEGQVTDMCFHRRGWFGVASADGKKVVRVITGKSGFLVPPGAIGSVAKTEGTVKVVTINPKDMEHYRKMHKFISDEDANSGKPIKQPIVIATGAEFKR